MTIDDMVECKWREILDRKMKEGKMEGYVNSWVYCIDCSGHHYDCPAYVSEASMKRLRKKVKRKPKIKYRHHRVHKTEK